MSVSLFLQNFVLANRLKHLLHRLYLFLNKIFINTKTPIKTRTPTKKFCERPNAINPSRIETIESRTPNLKIISQNTHTPPFVPAFCYNFNLPYTSNSHTNHRNPRVLKYTTVSSSSRIHELHPSFLCKTATASLSRPTGLDRFAFA